MAVKALLICLIGFAFIDAASVRLLPLEREAYAAVLTVFGLLAVLSLQRVRMSPMATAFTVSWVALGLIALLQGTWGHHWNITYVIGDFGVFMIPIFIFIAANAGKLSFFADRKVLDTLAYGLMIGAGISFFFGRDEQLGGRYIPPNLFLAAWLMAKVIAAKTIRKSQLYMGMLLLFGVVSYLSNERTTVVIWAGGMVVTMLSLRGRKIVHLAIPMILVGLIALLAQGQSGASSSGGFESRFSKLDGGSDDSLDGRFNEVSDMFATINRDWTTVDYLVGAGHGATFLPELPANPRKVVGGRIHNIHIGPALMFYRYGFMGMIGWLFWVGLLLVSIPKALRRNCPELDRIFILAAGFVFLDSLMRNPFVDPVSCFGVAGLFHVYLGGNREAISSAAATGGQ